MCIILTKILRTWTWDWSFCTRRSLRRFFFGKVLYIHYYFLLENKIENKQTIIFFYSKITFGHNSWNTIWYGGSISSSTNGMYSLIYQINQMLSIGASNMIRLPALQTNYGKADFFVQGSANNRHNIYPSVVHYSLTGYLL